MKLSIDYQRPGDDSVHCDFITVDDSNRSLDEIKQIIKDQTEKKIKKGLLDWTWFKVGNPI